VRIVIALFCPHCHAVAVVDAPPEIGKPLMCPCLDHPPITKPVAFMRLHLPEGYELIAKQREASA